MNSQMRIVREKTMQHEIINQTNLLDDNGNILEPGFAKKMLYTYNRDKITAPARRLKEWDYYYIGNDKYALCLTISDLGLVGALSLTVMDFVTPSQFTNTSIFLFPMGKVNMPLTSEVGDCGWKNGKVEMNFTNDGKVRHLTGVYPNADKQGTDVSWDIIIDEVPEESMVIATPFDKKGYFYFNQKINCMRATGMMKLNDMECPFDGANSMATLDWGRGVWTYDNTWYWGSLQTRLEDGSTFGWNIGYGFGNTEAASEDVLFYNGKTHKIGRTKFLIPGDGEKDSEPRYMEDWKFVSDDGRLDCTFHPLIDRYEPFDLKVMCMIPHQVFGYVTGKCILDDGKEIVLDNVLCFAEKVHNKW